MDQDNLTRRGGCDPTVDESRSKPTQKPVAFCWCHCRLACPRLGAREVQVLARLEEGKAYKEIALELSVSETLVHKLVHRVFLRLCAHNRTKALAHWRACCACGNADWSAVCRAVSALGNEITPARPRCPAGDAAPQDQFCGGGRTRCARSPGEDRH
jgi:DNA-binding CsgD family transcriptional regulator